MLVSSFDKHASNPPPLTAQPEGKRKSKDVATGTAGEQKSDRIKFGSGEHKNVRLFANQEQATQGRQESRPSEATSAQTLGPFSQLKSNLKGWCGGNRPPRPDPCPTPPCYTKPPRPPKPCPPERPKPDPCFSRPPERPKPCKPDPCFSRPPERPTPCKPDPCFSRPPERPTPCKPDPCHTRPPERPTPCKPDPCHGRPDPSYSNKSNDDLARMLLNNFDAFKDPKQPLFITTQMISDMASKPLSGNAAGDQNIRLARELMKRPDLVNAVDRHSTTGALDGLIDRKKIEMTLASNSPMKYQDDKQLASEMLRQFDKLNDPFYQNYISIDKLRDIAKLSTDDPVQGRLAWIAQEVLKRSDVMSQMDGGDNMWGTDGWIKKTTLKGMIN